MVPPQATACHFYFCPSPAPPDQPGPCVLPLGYTGSACASLTRPCTRLVRVSRPLTQLGRGSREARLRVGEARDWGPGLLPPTPLLHISVLLPPTSNTHHLKTTSTGPGLDKYSGPHFLPAAPEKPTLVRDMLEDILFVHLLKHKNTSQAHLPTYAEPCSLIQLPSSKAWEPAPNRLLQRAVVLAHRGQEGTPGQALTPPGSHEPLSSPTAQ